MNVIDNGRRIIWKTSIASYAFCMSSHGATGHGMDQKQFDCHNARLTSDFHAPYVITTLNYLFSLT